MLKFSRKKNKTIGQRQQQKENWVHLVKQWNKQYEQQCEFKTVENTLTRIFLPLLSSFGDGREKSEKHKVFSNNFCEKLSPPNTAQHNQQSAGKGASGCRVLIYKSA